MGAGDHHIIYGYLIYEDSSLNKLYNMLHLSLINAKIRRYNLLGLQHEQLYDRNEEDARPK